MASESEPVHAPLRPGVSFPDWSAVRSEKARAALRRLIDIENLTARWGDRSAEEDRVHVAVLRAYARRGGPPTAMDLAGATGLEQAAIVAALRSLGARDVLVFDIDGGALIGAYPLTERDTGHRVRLDDRTLNAMCAVDALGVGPMYGRDVTIESACRTCDAPIRISTGARGAALAAVDPPQAAVWMGLDFDGQAATSLCPVIPFFCSGTHLDAWRAERAAPEGFALTPDEAHQIGAALFGPFLRHTAAGSDAAG